MPGSTGDRPSPLNRASVNKEGPDREREEGHCREQGQQERGHRGKRPYEAFGKGE